MLDAAFLETFTVMLREGIEAILVIAALAAYMTRAGAGDRVNALYLGGLGAIIASFSTAWALEVFNSGVHNDMIEGVVMLVAAGLMFYVSGWLFLKQDPRAWQAYLKHHTDKVMEGGTVLAVAMLAFLSVFREGAETVLFLHAVSISRGGWSLAMIGGIAAASLALALVFVLVTRTTRRLPLRPVFLLTSAFLFLMGLKLIGEAMQEFQEQAMIGVHSTPASDVLTAIGLNASWEAIGTQLAIVAVAASSMWLMSRRSAGAGAQT